jgi:Ca-activated chloride channel homolog
MNRRSAVRLVTLSSAGLFFAGRITGHPQDVQPDFTIRSEARLVMLDVSVRDHAGRYATGLSKENFTVLEDGKRQPVTVFAGYDVPVTVGILVDESLSMTPKRHDVLTAATAFLGESNPHDEIFVLNFNDKVKPGLPPEILFSDDVQQLSAALYRGKPEGKTALYDAIVAGIRQLEQGRRGKKALIVISDGGDNASARKRSEMLEAVESSVATIYTVGLFGPEDQDRDPRVLKQVARISGGGAYFPSSAPETIPVCRGIAKEIRSRYTIGYVPQAGKSSGQLRHLQVLVSAEGRDKLTAHTRTSYRYVESGGEQTTR